MTLGPFTGVDLLLGGAILLFALRGLLRGLVRELFALAAIVAGWIVASRYHLSVSEQLPSIAENEFLTSAIAFTLIFLAAALGVRLLGAAIHKVISDTPIGWLNRMAGALCGLLAGTILVGVLLMVLTIYLPGGQSVFDNSVLYPHLTHVIGLLASVLPERAQEIFDQHFNGPGVTLPESLKDFV